MININIIRPGGSDEETLAILREIEGSEGLSNVALLTPADDRIPFIEKFLKEQAFSDSVLFIEKPFGRIHEEIEAMRHLDREYPGRLHFSEKYTHRADDFVNKASGAVFVPDKIEAKMIEGGHYYDVVKNRRNHPYRKDGPELDLGIHILGIISAIAEKLGGFEGFEVVSASDPATDASQPKDQYDKGFVCTANLTLKVKNGKSIPVSLAVGKAKGRTERYINLNYQGAIELKQQFSEQGAHDPVSLSLLGNLARMSLRSDAENFQYYLQELEGELGQHTPSEQSRILDVNDTCITIKELREKSY